MNYQLKKKYYWIVLFLDKLGSLVFKKREKPKKIKRIAVIRTDHIGDMLLTTPLIKKIKKQNPNSELTVITRKNSLPILKNNPYVDRTIIFEPPWFARNKSDDYKKVWKFTQIHRNEFDLIYEPKGDIRNIVVAKRISKYCIGFGIRGGSFLLDKTIKFKEKKHIVEIMLAMVGEKSGELIFINEKKSLTKMKKKLPKKFVCVNIGAGSEEKLWPKFPEFIEKISKERTVVVLDIKKHKTIKGTVNLTGKLNLEEFAAVIKLSDALISVDSLAGHLGATFKKPILSIQCPHGQVWQWKPYTDKLVIVERYIGKYSSKKEGIEHMKKLEVKTVMEAWNELKKIID